MERPNRSRNISELIALVNTMIAYWKSIAGRRFQKANPNSDPTEFEREWPKVLDNFFLAETVRTVRLLRSLPYEGLNN
jgi:hypothetical protein